MKIGFSPAAGLVTTHAAVTAAVHGITGDIVGTTDTQTLTNKTLSDLISLTLKGQGGADDPIIEVIASAIYHALGIYASMLPKVDDESYIGWGGAGDIALLRWKTLFLSDDIRFTDASGNYIKLAYSAPSGSDYTATFPAATGTVTLGCKHINKGNFAISGKLGFGKKQKLLGEIWLDDEGLHILWKGKERII